MDKELVLKITKENPNIEYFIPKYNGGMVRTLNSESFTVCNVKKIQIEIENEFFRIRLFDDNNGMIGLYTTLVDDLFKKREEIFLYHNIEPSGIYEFNI